MGKEGERERERERKGGRESQGTKRKPVNTVRDRIYLPSLYVIRPAEGWRGLTLGSGPSSSAHLRRPARVSSESDADGWTLRAERAAGGWRGRAGAEREARWGAFPQRPLTCRGQRIAGKIRSDPQHTHTHTHILLPTCVSLLPVSLFIQTLTLQTARTCQEANHRPSSAPP